MRCLGLDLGSKTLGIAISDRTNLIASVYKTIFFNPIKIVLIKTVRIVPKRTF